MIFKSICKQSVYSDITLSQIAEKGNIYDIEYHELLDEYEILHARKEFRALYKSAGGRLVFGMLRFNDYFHTLEEMRDIKINNILNDVICKEEI